jgi:glycogen(starch) synthase
MHLSWEFPPRCVGGLAAHVNELTKVLAKLDAEIHVITCDFPMTPNYEHIDGIHVHRFESFVIPSPDFLAWALQMNLYMRLKAIDVNRKFGPFDLIHVHDWLAAPAGISLKHGLRIPLVATIHSTEHGRRRGISSTFQGMIHNIEHWLMFESWYVICCSHYMFNEIIKHFSVPSDKLFIIPNGVTIEKFEFREDSDTFRKRFAYPWEKIILHIGRLVPEKGANVLIGALPKILSTDPNVKLVIAGDGYMKEEYIRLAHYMGVGQKTYITGYLDNFTLKALLRVADVAVFPSIYEPFGIVVLEAMAAGIPVVVSDIGGLSEIVAHEIDGIKVWADNSDSLAWGIKRVLYDKKLADVIRKNAFKKIKEKYDWNKIAKTTLDIYSRVIDEHKKSGWTKNKN